MDLHIHTNYSDGTDDVKTILEKSKALGIDWISITDHDCCDAYYDLEKIPISDYYDGHIVSGIEITTSFNKRRIEILAYGFDDYRKVNYYFKETNYIDWSSVLVELRKELLIKFDSLNLKYDVLFRDREKQIHLDKYEAKVYASLMELNLNLRDILKEEYCEDASLFFRKCISNPDSIFYMNFSQYYPSLEEVIQFIHSQNGLCFFAHPYGYELPNPEQFMTDLYDYCEDRGCSLDGIETYYSLFSEEQIQKIEEFAQQRNLLMSGGSDYHGTVRENITLGRYLNQSRKIPDTFLNLRNRLLDDRFW